MKCEIDIDNKTIKFDEEYKESVYIHGGKTDSSCEFAEGQLLMAVKAHNVILIAQNWVVTHQTHVDGDFAVSPSLLLPGFSIEELPIIFELGKKTYNLVNVCSGHRDILIKASAKNDERQHPVHIRGLDNDRICIDFSATDFNQDNVEG